MDAKMMSDCMKMMHGMHKSGGTGMAMGAGSGLVRGTLGRSLLSRPLAVFSLGATVGALVYKNRDKIFKGLEPATKGVVRSVARTSDAGKDFIQEQKEKLSDIIAEVKEEEEESAKAKVESED